jgi:hypothetical protein
LQIDNDLFLQSTVFYDDLLNHSCNPNCFIAWSKVCLIASQDIKAGEELTYNYNTSEYDLLEDNNDFSFMCKCGCENCVGIVKGFKYLTLKQKISFKDNLSPFLKSKLPN